MSDEIKEILNDLQRVADRKCYPEDILDGSIAQEWVDYITNLQSKIDKIITLTEPFIKQKESIINGEILKRIYDIAKGE